LHASSTIFNFPGYYDLLRTGFPEWYVVFLGVGAIAYSFNGYDCSARMSEETSLDEFEESRVAPARCIIHTIIASSSLGMLVIVALLFATTNIPDAISGSTTISSGNAAVNVIVAACGVDVAAAIAWSFLFVIFISGVSCATGGSRVCFVLARDQMLPFSEWLSEIDADTQCPVNAVIFNGGISILICLLALTPINQNAFYCIIGMSTVSIRYIQFFISSLTIDYIFSRAVHLYLMQLRYWRG
jgi:amino acid transporter